jgi:hypothetical protein
MWAMTEKPESTSSAGFRVFAALVGTAFVAGCFLTSSWWERANDFVLTILLAVLAIRGTR